MISSAGSVGPQQNFAYKSHSRSSLWSISWLCHQMFYPYVKISAAQARESDNLRHALTPFSLCLSSFLGTQRILGYVRPGRIVAVHLEDPSDWDAFVRRCDVIGLQMLLWKMQILLTAQWGLTWSGGEELKVLFCDFWREQLWIFVLLCLYLVSVGCLDSVSCL